EHPLPEMRERHPGRLGIHPQAHGLRRCGSRHREALRGDQRERSRTQCKTPNTLCYFHGESLLACAVETFTSAAESRSTRRVRPALVPVARPARRAESGEAPARAFGGRCPPCGAAIPTHRAETARRVPD